MNIIKSKLIYIIILVCIPSLIKSQGIFGDEENYFYFKGAGAFSSYFGDLNSVNTDKPFFSHAYKIGTGYFITPTISLGFDYRVADYPRTDRPNAAGYTKNHTTNLYARYSFLFDEEISPYVLGGLGMTFFGTYDKGVHERDGSTHFAPAFGPVLGFGVDVRLTDRISFFFESKFDFVLDDEAMDEVRGSAGFDMLGFFGAGIRFNLRPSFRPVEEVSISGPDRITSGQSVIFTAVIEGDPTEPVRVQWDLGDGSRSLGESVSHVYRETGVYTVSALVSNRRSGREVEKDIEVVDPPYRASIVYLETEELEYTAGEPVRFEIEVTGTEPISYIWDFGDGTTSAERSPEHTYDEPGLYRVILRVDNTEIAGRTGVDQRSVTVYVR